MQKYHGRIDITKLMSNKNLWSKSSQGHDMAWVDFIEKKQPDQYGSTHTLTMWSKETGTIYLGDFKLVDTNAAPQPARTPLYEKAKEQPAPAPEAQDGPDLPF